MGRATEVAKSPWWAVALALIGLVTGVVKFRSEREETRQLLLKQQQEQVAADQQFSRLGNQNVKTLADAHDQLVNRLDQALRADHARMSALEDDIEAVKQECRRPRELVRAPVRHHRAPQHEGSGDADGDGILADQDAEPAPTVVQQRRTFSNASLDLGALRQYRGALKQLPIRPPVEQKP